MTQSLKETSRNPMSSNCNLVDLIRAYQMRLFLGQLRLHSSRSGHVKFGPFFDFHLTQSLKETSRNPMSSNCNHVELLRAYKMRLFLGRLRLHSSRSGHVKFGPFWVCFYHFFLSFHINNDLFPLIHINNDLFHTHVWTFHDKNIFSTWSSISQP